MKPVYVDDDSFYQVYDYFKELNETTHLDETLRYSKLLEAIDEDISYINVEFGWQKLDAETITMLINQARTINQQEKEKNDGEKNPKYKFVNDDSLIAKFILFMGNPSSYGEMFARNGFLDPNKTANILDPVIYKRIIDALEGNYNTGEIRRQRKIKLADTLLKKINVINLFLDAKDYVKTYDYYENDELLSLNFILDLVSDFFFGDFYKNVCIDINEMFKYEKLTGKALIPEERRELYNRFVQLNEEKLSNIILFIDEFKEKGLQFCSNEEDNLETQFYQDVRDIKDNSYENLLEKCTVFDKSSPLYNPTLSSKYGCDTFYLNGEPFFALVRTDVRIEKEKQQPSKEKTDRLGYSYTFIGTDDVRLYENPSIFASFVYKGVSPRNIVHINKDDSESAEGYYYASDFPNEIHTPDSILKETVSYPEVFIRNPDDGSLEEPLEEDNIPPQKVGLICMDSPTEWDIEYAKNNNLSLIIINSKQYPIKDGRKPYSLEETYRR